MVLRPILLTLLVFGSLFLLPGAQAAPCDASGPDISCSKTVQRCDLEAGANVVTTAAAGASADCRLGNMTRCYAAVGVTWADPSVERWCAF